MKRFKFNLAALIVLITAMLAWSNVQAEVKHRQINKDNLVVDVKDEAWQPEGFENGTVIPASYLGTSSITVDGKDNEPAWQEAVEVEVPLFFGSMKSAFLKALYTDQEAFIRVRWADDDEDRQHRPWVWDSSQKKFVEGSQQEDSVLLSFEAGCDWNPSLLAGYVYDFDGWHWMAARTDPLGQALDLNGHIQDRDIKDMNFSKYQSRVTKDTWNMKFTENRDPDLHATWSELDRVYLKQPVTETLYFQVAPDTLGRKPPAFVKQMAAPTGIPYPHEESKVFPQFSPVKLQGGAGEVSAKGQWEDGFWTVEFRRKRITPARTANDSMLQRLTQFSVHVFDSTEQVDQSSESKRLFLQFLPEKPHLAQD